jgi:hypothetical protein
MNRGPRKTMISLSVKGLICSKNKRPEKANPGLKIKMMTMQMISGHPSSLIPSKKTAFLKDMWQLRLQA